MWGASQTRWQDLLKPPVFLGMTFSKISLPALSYWLYVISIRFEPSPRIAPWARLEEFDCSPLYICKTWTSARGSDLLKVSVIGKNPSQDMAGPRPLSWYFILTLGCQHSWALAVLDFCVFDQRGVWVREGRTLVHPSLPLGLFLYPVVSYLTVLWDANKIRLMAWILSPRQWRLWGCPSFSPWEDQLECFWP